MKVLIIDDEQGVLKMYSEYLTSIGKFQVLEASDGVEGMKIAKEQKPDIILLDIIMPKYNGLDVLKDIKNDPDLKNIPVFLLTNLPSDSSGDKAKELGAAGYLVKAEYEPKMLLGILQGAIKK